MTRCTCPDHDGTHDMRCDEVRHLYQEQHFEPEPPVRELPWDYWLMLARVWGIVLALGAGAWLVVRLIIQAARRAA